jgi:hypothetical protein
MRTIVLTAESLATQNLFFDIRNGNVEITDNSEPLALFQMEAVETVAAMFGDHRADEMLHEAASMINGEMFARRMRNAMLNSTK